MQIEMKITNYKGIVWTIFFCFYAVCKTIYILLTFFMSYDDF